jgi:hypothetical protein
MSTSSSADADPPSPPSEDAAGAQAKPSADDAQAAPDAAPKPKKKKKRKREAPAGPLRDPLAPDGSERPTFLLDYPSDPELERLVQAFELGNYAYVREHAPLLAEKGKEPRVRAAAGELARRIEPDPLVKLLLAMSLALFLALALWAFATHGS